MISVSDLSNDENDQHKQYFKKSHFPNCDQHKGNLRKNLKDELDDTFSTQAFVAKRKTIIPLLNFFKTLIATLKNF